jgi:hypothetical protein
MNTEHNKDLHNLCTSLIIATLINNSVPKMTGVNDVRVYKHAWLPLRRR